MTKSYQTRGNFYVKFGNEFQYSTNLESTSSYSVITDLNYCQYSNCDANKEVQVASVRDSTLSQTSALMGDDGCKFAHNATIVLSI